MTPRPSDPGPELHVPAALRAAALGWSGRAAEVGAAASLLHAAEPGGVSPAAGSAVVSALATAEEALLRLRADVQAHAVALADTVRDLAASDAAAEQALADVRVRDVPGLR